MKIQLSDHFNYRHLMRFTAPSILMMIFTSVYGVVDGFFVSNFAGKTAFAAVNFIMPYLIMLGAVGFMLGTGGSALVAKTLGEGDRARANGIFSFIVYLTLGGGVLLSLGGILFLPTAAALLGAEGEMLSGCILYGRIILCALPAFMLQILFQSFFVTAEKPQLGLWVTVASGCANILLDALLVGLLPLGLVGAAMATAISQAVGGIVPLFYFAGRNKSLLRLGRPLLSGLALWRTLSNGSSEFLSNISMSLVGMLYNFQLMRYAGENGVAAYGVLMYVGMIFMAIFIGYTIGVAPVVGYHFGAENRKELQSLLGKSLLLIGICSVGMLALGEALALPLSHLFTGYDPALFAITKQGFFIYSVSFLFSGIAIFASGFFTALNNGAVSALISSLRTVVFQTAAVLLLPLWWELDGLWFSIVVAELLAALVAILCLGANRKKYGY